MRTRAGNRSTADVGEFAALRPAVAESAADLRGALDAAGTPYRVATYLPKEIIFLQGSASDSVVYVECGSVRLTVTAPNGKEATLGLLGPGAFLGEEVIVGYTERADTATAMIDTTVIEIEKAEMLRQLGTRHVL